MVSTLVIALPASGPVEPATSSVLTTDATRAKTTCTSAVPAAERTLRTSPWRSGNIWVTWGFRGALTTTRQGYFTDYSVSFLVSLPLARILGSYAFTGTISLRSTPLCRSAFAFRHPSYFAVARVVDEDHPFMLACRHGDTETVRLMLRSGEGRPTDVTLHGNTPMAVSHRIRNYRCTYL